MVIYSIKNTFNEKVYIGCTSKLDPNDRWKQHIQACNRGEHNLVYKAMRKYGIENFTFEVIKTLDESDDIFEMEMEYIKQHDSYENGYNMTIGGDGMIGLSFTDEHKRKISESNKGKKCSPEHIEKNRQAKLKNPTNYWLGKKMPKSMVDKLKKVHCKPVLQFTKDGEFIKEYPSIKEAQDELSIHQISKVCNGKRKTAGGFKWRFK